MLDRPAGSDRGTGLRRAGEKVPRCKSGIPPAGTRKASLPALQITFGRVSQLFSITRFQILINKKQIMFLYLAETNTFEVQSAHPFWFPNIYYEHLTGCLTLMKVSSKIPFCNYILYRNLFLI